MPPKSKSKKREERQQARRAAAAVKEEPLEMAEEEEEPFVPSDPEADEPAVQQQQQQPTEEDAPANASEEASPSADDGGEDGEEREESSAAPSSAEAAAADEPEGEAEKDTAGEQRRSRRRPRPSESSSSSSSREEGEECPASAVEAAARALNLPGTQQQDSDGASTEGRGRPSQVRPTSRLVIRDIDVENFKSYYGQHRIGPFHKTFTAVIGPNGSGKSNVIDSMLFVFGRNAKKIRLEKLSELIHSSAAHPNISYASVTVNFIRVRETTTEDAADPTQREEIPDSTIRIKREVFRSGVSQYFIDGRRTTQKEVVERLIAEGVDLEHNRFLILQGEVEQIALMKPKAEKEGEEGLLEYLDDLIGTNEFIDRINRATRHAEEAQSARLDALDTERKLKAEREALDAAKDSTLAFVTKDNQLQKTLIVMCQLRMRGIEERLIEPRKLLEEIDVRIQKFEGEVAEGKENKAAAEEEVARRRKELAEATRDRDAIRHEKQTEEATLERLKSGADEQEKATKRLEDLIKKCKDESQKASLQQQDAEREAAIHQQNLEEAAGQVEALQQKHDQLSEELLPKLRPLRQELDKKKREVAPYEKAVTIAEEELNTAKGRLTALEGAEEAKARQLEELQGKREQRAARIVEVQQTLAEAETSEKQKEEVSRLQDLVTEATQRKYRINSSINEMKSMYREGEQDDRAMEFLLSQRNLQGYYGTLRQLGRIADEYDIAAGMASNAWGFHVVEDRATATAALEALKKNNMGRATMMVVSEIEREMGARAAKAFTCPNPKAHRLFDLITPTNAKFRTVFYQAVRDTLVVNTLAEARETAFGGGQRYRVVTRKGELVEPSGTITGGGAAPRGARLKAARSPQDKQAIKEELIRLQKELMQAAEEEAAGQRRLHAVMEEGRRVSPEQLRRLRTELHTLTATSENDAARVEAMQQEVAALRKETDAKRAELGVAIERCEGKWEAAVRARDDQNKAVQELEQRVEEEGGSAFREVTDQLKAQSTRQEAEETALRTCRRLAQKLRATQERKEKDIADHRTALEKLRAEAEEGLREKVAQHVKQLEEITARHNVAEARVASAQSASDDARAAVPVANSALIEAQKRLDDEMRYRQTESAKMADALQELAKFEQKIEGCEEKIKENAELYGVETLQLPHDPAQEEEEEDEGDDLSDGEDEENEKRRRHRSRRKRGRSTSTSGGEDEDGENSDEDDDDDERRAGGGRRGRGRGGDAASVPATRTAAQIRAMTFKLSTEELERCDYERSVHLAKALSEETKRLHGDIDFRAVALWRERDVAHREALMAYEAAKSTSDEADLALLDMKEDRRDAFMKDFNRIRGKLKEVYQMLTHGGDADMELVDVNDPFEGIHFVVRPPKKSWKQISNLSGGEKTLSSLALIFSLHHIKPTPIYVMDEIDAALDFRNVSIVANYVLRQASGAQFIIISLRNNMFELAHQLVGVCKVKDVTTTLVLMPRAFQRTMQRRLEAAKERHGARRQQQQPGQITAAAAPTRREQPGAAPEAQNVAAGVSPASAEAGQTSPPALRDRTNYANSSGSLTAEKAMGRPSGEEAAPSSGRPSSATGRTVRFSDEVR